MRGMVDQLLKTDFMSFVGAFFPILHPNQTLADEWQLEALSYALSEISSGRRRRQIINMPPRTLKSIVVSVLWTAFRLGQNPATKVIVVSYAEDLAVDLHNKVRRVMESPQYRKLFPGTQVQRNTQTVLETTAGGMRLATTIEGGLTGFGADVIILDDPHNATDIVSKPARDKVWGFFRGTLQSRLNDPATGAIVVVQQRLHEDDLTGHLLETGGYELLKLQARATVAAVVPLSAGTTHRVEIGDLLYPRRLSGKLLDQLRREMGGAAFAAQYEQEPVPVDGSIIKRGWLQYVQSRSVNSTRLTFSLDTAIKTTTASDYSVCTVWEEADGRHYLIDVWRERVEFPALQSRLFALAALYKPTAILIEDQGSGSSLIQTLRRERWTVIPCRPKGPKEVRLDAVSTFFEGGKVVLLKDAPWLTALESELLGFPGTRYDDQVDSVSQYLTWVHSRPSSTFEADFGYDDDGPNHEDIALQIVGLYPFRS